MSFFGKPETAKELARGYKPLVLFVKLCLFFRLLEDDWAADFIDGLTLQILEYWFKEHDLPLTD